LSIYFIEANIENAYEGIRDEIGKSLDFNGCKNPYTTVYGNPMIKTNLPARLRMATLYAVAALYPNSRVVNTCNRSEDYVGYSTKYGDAAGDFSPLGNLTVREVLEIGDELGLPEHLVHKAPSDGMCGKTDEDNLGFTYEQLDDHILGTAAVDEEVVEKIERLHKATRHKYKPMPTFHPIWTEIASEQLSIEDYANGGLVDPTIMASSMTGQIGANPMKEFDEPAAINIDFNVNKTDIQRITENIANALNAEISFYGRR
jgi:NH3-dependent NAD+ synthetase